MTKISELPEIAAEDIDGTETMPIVKDGTLYRSETLIAVKRAIPFLTDEAHDGWKFVLKNLANFLQFGVDDAGWTHANLASLTSSLGGLVRWDMSSDYEGWFLVILDESKYLQFGIKTDGTVVPGSDADITALTEEIEAARGLQGSLEDRLFPTIAATGYAKTVYHNAGNLRDWHWKLAKARGGDGLAIFAVAADSWSSRQPGYIIDWQAEMKAVHGDGGAGWIPMAAGVRSASGITPTLTGTWATTNVTGRGPDLKEVTSSTAGDRISIPIPAGHTSAQIFYLKQPGGGSYRYSVDGGATWVATIDTADAADALGIEAYVPPAGAYTLVVEVVAGPNTMFGGPAYKDFGFVCHKIAMSGSTSEDWSGASAVSKDAWAALGMDCIQIGPLGTNDQNSDIPVADLKTAYEALISDFRTAYPTIDIVLAASPKNTTAGSVSILDYQAAVLDIGYDPAARVAVIDIQRSWGDLAEYGASSSRVFLDENVDPIHPTTDGYWSLVALMLGLYSYGVR